MTAHLLRKENFGDMSPSEFGLSHHNLSSSHLATLNLSPTVSVTDLSLREGRQVGGLDLRLADIERYAELAAEAGVSNFEVFNKVDEIKVVAEASRAGVQVLVPPGEVFGRALRPDFSAYADAGATTLSLVSMALNPALGSLPDTIAGEPMSEALMQERVYAAIQQALETGLKVNLLILDFLRADLETVLNLTQVALDAGADGIRLDDCCAPATPSVYRSVVERIRRANPDITIAIHSHNDFSLALATQLAAVEGGANVVEGSVLGLGEKAGVAEIGMLAVALHLFYGYETGVRTDQIATLSDLASELWREAIPSHAPGVGVTAFGCVTDVHYLPGILPTTFNAWPSTMVGRQPSVPMSGLSGPNGLGRRLRMIGIDPSTVDLPELLARVKAAVAETHRDPTDSEMFSLASVVAPSP